MSGKQQKLPRLIVGFYHILPIFTLMFKIENGKIVEAQNFLSDQHQADAFFWRVYPLKPLPDRLAQKN